MTLILILLAYVLFWIFWWVVIPSAKVIGLYVKYDVELLGKVTYETSLIFSAKLDRHKIKVVTDFKLDNRMANNRRIKYDIYLYHDFVKYALNTASNAIKIDPNIKVIDIYYSNFKNGKGAQNV